MKCILLILFLTQKIYASTPVGTVERVEHEYKLAFELHENFSIDQLVRFADKEIKRLESLNELSFPKLFSSTYTVQNDLKPFMFKDYYIDTDNLDILKSQSAYRLRYRWSELANYYKFQTFPFLPQYYPTRCEIQFKRNYVIDPVNSDATTNESRFEFRNESEPFIEKMDAPKAPWPVEEYLNFALTGQYLEHQILPTAIVRNTIKQDQPKLSNVVTVETIRYRTHLNASATPWGWGPNPGQIFIITFDYSHWTYADGSKNKKPVLEIEIEIDRNTKIMVENGQQIEATNLINLLAIEHSAEAQKRLRTDQKNVKKMLHESILQLKIGTLLPTNFKYNRIMEKKSR